MEKVKKILGTIKDAIPKPYIKRVEKALSEPYDIDAEKEEVWKDFADIYYKYGDDNVQKRAVREVLHETSELIADDKWETVYQKLRRIHNKYSRYWPLSAGSDK